MPKSAIRNICLVLLILGLSINAVLAQKNNDTINKKEFNGVVVYSYKNIENKLFYGFAFVNIFLLAR